MRIFCLCLAFLFLPVFAAAEERAGYRLLKFDGRPVKWGETAYGAGSRVTYAFLTQPTQFDDARNCRAMAPADGFLEAQNIEKAAFEASVAEAFAMWEAAAGVRFVQTVDPEGADILIGADLEKRGWAHADVRAGAAVGAIRPIERSLVCLNPERPWKIGFGKDRDAQDIRYTVSHEIGHAIGLNHASPEGQLMSFIYGEDFADLQPGDINGARALYGPAAQHDNLAAAAPASRTP